MLSERVIGKKGDQTTYTLIKNYIEKKEGNDRLLLLFLFNVSAK